MAFFCKPTVDCFSVFVLKLSQHNPNPNYLDFIRLITFLITRKSMSVWAKYKVFYLILFQSGWGFFIVSLISWTSIGIATNQIDTTCLIKSVQVTLRTQADVDYETTIQQFLTSSRDSRLRSWYWFWSSWHFPPIIAQE